jgi:hypothetical protein
LVIALIREGINAIVGWQKLRVIGISFSPIDDSCVELLSSMESLRVVVQSLAGLSDAGIAALHQSRPDIQINDLPFRATEWGGADGPLFTE